MSKALKPPKTGFTFEIRDKNGTPSVYVLAPAHYRQYLKTKTRTGDKGTLYLSFKKPTRSEQQLRYYWVLIGYLAEYTGFTEDEVHDALMKLKFGTKTIQIGNDRVEVRKSISNSARFPKSDMLELIDFAMEKCMEFDIHVPSAQELGYITNYGGYKTE